MAKRPQTILDRLAGILNGMDCVFSTPQWGGRAYKVAKPGGSPGKPKGKILAFVAPDDNGKAIQVTFKIPPADAETACERHAWIQPHSFRTLAPSGWLTATVSTKRQVATLTRFLEQSHAAFGVTADKPPANSRPRGVGDEQASHIDRVMGQVRDDGWAPQSDW